MEIKNIVITGASSGIGASLSEYYACTGITLGLISLNKERLETVASMCRDSGADVHTYVADVTNRQLMEQCAADFCKHTASVDLVIANAGIRIEEDKDFAENAVPEKLINTNYLGAINTFVPFISVMKKQKQGNLAVISSIAAFRGTPNSGAYSASKAAINLWTESLRLRLYPYNINVCTLCVGFVQTAMTADLTFNLPGIISAEKAAKKIALAIKRRKRTATFPWQSKWIWMVFRILPGRLYDRLILLAKSKHPK